MPAKGEVSAPPKSQPCSSTVHRCCRCGIRIIFNRVAGWVHYGGPRDDDTAGGNRPAGGCPTPRHNPRTCPIGQEAAA